MFGFLLFGALYLFFKGEVVLSGSCSLASAVIQVVHLSGVFVAVMMPLGASLNIPCICTLLDKQFVGCRYALRFGFGCYWLMVFTWRSDCLSSIASVVFWLWRLWKPSVLLFLSASNGAFKDVEMATDFVEPLVVEVLPTQSWKCVRFLYDHRTAACFPDVFRRNDSVAFDQYITYICFCCLVEFAAKNVIYKVAYSCAAGENDDYEYGDYDYDDHDWSWWF